MYFIKQVNFVFVVVLFYPPIDDEYIMLYCVLVTHFPSDIEWCLIFNPQSNSINGMKELLRRKDEIENRNIRTHKKLQILNLRKVEC